MKRIYRLLTAVFLVCSLMTSCSYKYYQAVDASFKVIEVKAVDLEEDDWLLSSGSDEVVTKYLISAIDANGRVVDQRGKSYGPYDFTYRGQVMTGFAEVQVRVPPKGQLVVSAILIEDDDYSAISRSIDDMQTLVDIAEYANDFRSSRGSNKSRTIGRRLRLTGRMLGYAGIAVTIVDLFDANDVLLRQCVVLTAEQLRKLGDKTITQVLRAAREHNFDFYDYRLSYRLTLKPDPTEVVKERNKQNKQARRSPVVYASFSPYASGGDINGYWLRHGDSFMYENPEEEDNYLWGDGLTDAQYEAELGILLSPTIMLGKKEETFSRFYLNGGYRQSSYFANRDEYRLLYDTQTYFGEESVLTGTAFTLDSLSLNIRDLSLGISYDIMAPGLLLQFGGGLVRRSANLRFIEPEISNGYEFTYDEDTEIFTNAYLPYAAFDIGLGSIRRKGGVVFNIGSQLLFANDAFTDAFQIYDGDNNSEKLSSDFDKKIYTFIGFGLRFML